MGEIGRSASESVGFGNPDVRIPPDRLREYVRGCLTSNGGGVSYPRADPRDRDRLPGDTWGAASIPATVRLEFDGDFESIEIQYFTQTDELGYRGDGAGTNFALWRDGCLICQSPATLGEGTTRLDVPARDFLNSTSGASRWILYLPEGMKPTVRDLRSTGGEITPASYQPIWLAYGDSVLEGWTATQPALAWPAIVGRECGIDVVNWGYAGAARGEIVTAQQIAQLANYERKIEIISISHGTNCWTRIPFSVQMMEAQLAAFIEIVRTGHPQTPILVVTPVLRPDAENTPNILGASLSQLREAMEQTVRSMIGMGDENLHLISGRDLISQEQLADGIHPNDSGHRSLADRIGPKILSLMWSEKDCW